MSEQGQGRRVLFVDDDPEVRRQFARCMTRAGYTVDTVGGGEDAIAQARQSEYKVVVTDLCMPEMDGTELMSRLSAEHPEMLFVVMSGMSRADVATQSSTSQAVCSVVCKPWEPAELCDAVDSAWEVAMSRTRRRDSADVLVIEHHKNNAKHLVRCLRLSGFDAAHVASSLEEARCVLENRNFDAILTSMRLPDAGGLHCIGELRRSAPNAAILAVSDQGDEELALQAMELGAQDVIDWPVTASALRRALRFALQRKQSEQRLLRMSRTDELTGLANRCSFAEALRRGMSRARRTSSTCAVMYLDLDRFKAINDSLGHAAGDELLRQVSQRLLTCVRETDTVARLGGDEFAIILEALDQEGGPEVVARRIVESFQEAFDLGESLVQVTTSIGIANSPQVAQHPEELVKLADMAMYRAKQSGRNQFAVADGVSSIHDKASGPVLAQGTQFIEPRKLVAV